LRNPIPLPRGRYLVTLEDVGRYITRLPRAEHEAAESQIASSRARPGVWGRGEGGARPLDRAGQDRPQAFDCASTSTRSRSIVVSLWRWPSCPPSIHRFVIVAPRGAAWAETRGGTGVCTGNLIRVDDVMESPKLAEWSGCSVSFWPSWACHSSRSYGLKLRTRCFDIS
jgi:hypothetical protein